MSRDDRERLAPHFNRVLLRHGDVLALYQAPIDYVYFPVDAVTSTLMELVDGESVEVGLMGAEGMTGLSLLYGARVSNTTVIDQIGGSADRMEAGVFYREVVERASPLYHMLLRYANAFMEMMAQVAACNATHSVEQRAARWILLAHDRVAHDSFPLTHEYLALMLGVRRASVSGVANLLRMAGAIDYSRGHFEVLDRKSLIDASCACYAAMVNTMDNLFDGAAR